MEEQEKVEVVEKKARKKKEAPPSKSFKQIRNSDGLIEGVEHPLDELGFPNWKEMVPKEFVALNKQAYAAEGINVDVLSPEEVETFKAGAAETHKLILLGGFKYLARLRGILSQEFRLVDSDRDVAKVSCTIKFIPNFENPEGLTMTTVMSQLKERTDPRFAQYLEALASNRAFIRCVKEALNINILGYEEIDQTEKVEVKVKPGSPTELLIKKSEEMSLTFEDVHGILKDEVGVEMKPEWVSFETLPGPVILSFLGFIKNKKIKK